MQITDIKVRKLMEEGRLRAVVSVTVGDEIAIHDLKVIEGPQRLFVAMPSRRETGGVFRDIVHPITPSARKQLEDAGLNLSGTSPDGRLVEAVELTDRDFFIGVQFHPEFKSRPNRAHPLFKAFVAASLKRSKEHAD